MSSTFNTALAEPVAQSGSLSSPLSSFTSLSGIQTMLLNPSVSSSRYYAYWALAIVSILCLSSRDFARYLCRCAPGITSIAVILTCASGNHWILSAIFLVNYGATLGLVHRTLYGLVKTTSEIKKLIRIQERNATKDAASLIPATSSVRHVIILPNYQETLDTLEESLSVLAYHPLAKSSYHVVLAMEEGEKGAADKAATLIGRFRGYFHKMTFTVHPKGIPGEARGKSSNVAWASRQTYKILVAESDCISFDRVIVTVMDADSHLLSDYFGEITKYLEKNLGKEGIYSYSYFLPPICFDRNAHDVASIVRATDIMWSVAGLGGFYDSSRIRIPTSCYSVSLNLVKYVDFWDADDTAIGEDMHMYLKIYLATGGHLNQVPIFVPASQCNVAGEVPPDSPSTFLWFCSSFKARFSQALRHLWGSLDTGYFLYNGLASVTATFDAKVCDCDDSKTCLCSKPLSIANFCTLFQRLYEAHLLPVHYVIALILCDLINYTSYAYISHILVPSHIGQFPLRQCLQWMQHCTVLFTVFQIILYERYHKAALEYRKNEMQLAQRQFSKDPSSSEQLSHIKGVTYSSRDRRRYYLDYPLLPVAGAFFVIIAAVRSQLLHFWTTSMNYQVSFKPSSKAKTAACQN